MRIISSDEIDACLTDRAVLETLRQAYRSTAKTGQPARIDIPRPPDSTGILSLQSAWTDFVAQGHTDRGYIGCAVTLDLPEHRDMASSLYLLMSGQGGHPIALLDGARLGVWRTAGLHALASAYLAREDTTRVLVIGDHPRLPRVLAAHASVRKITSVLLTGASDDLNQRIIGLPHLKNVSIGTTTDISAAVAGADMVCLAGPDASTGQWADLSTFDPPAGCHIDLLTATAPLAPALWQDARLFTSDLLAPPHDQGEWAAGLAEVARGERAGRRYYGQTTLFAPGRGTALADFALAAHVFLRT